MSILGPPANKVHPSLPPIPKRPLPRKNSVTLFTSRSQDDASPTSNSVRILTRKLSRTILPIALPLTPYAPNAISTPRPSSPLISPSPLRSNTPTSFTPTEPFSSALDSIGSSVDTTVVTDDPFSDATLLTLVFKYVFLILKLGVLTAGLLIGITSIPLNPIDSKRLAPNINYGIMAMFLSLWAGMPRAAIIFQLLAHDSTDTLIRSSVSEGVHKSKWQRWAAGTSVTSSLLKYWCVLPIPIISIVIAFVPLATGAFPVPFLMSVTPSVVALLVVRPLAMLNYSKDIRSSQEIQARITSALHVLTPTTVLTFMTLLFFYLYFITPPLGSGILQALILGSFNFLGITCRYVSAWIASVTNAPKVVDCCARFYSAFIIQVVGMMVLPKSWGASLLVILLAVRTIILFSPIVQCTRWFERLVCTIVPPSFCEYKVDKKKVTKECLNLFTTQMAVATNGIIYIPFAVYFYYGRNKPYTFFYAFGFEDMMYTMIYVGSDMFLSTLVFWGSRRFFQKYHELDLLMVGLQKVKHAFVPFFAVTMTGYVLVFATLLKQSNIVYYFAPELYG